jgi:hypothetical protein
VPSLARVTSLALAHDWEAVVSSQQSASMSSYPVHRSLPPTRRSKSDERRAARKASKGLREASEGSSIGAWERTMHAEITRVTPGG